MGLYISGSAKETAQGGGARQKRATEKTQEGRKKKLTSFKTLQEMAGDGIASAVREGLLAYCVEVGLEQFQQLMEEEVTEIAGVRGRHNAKRTAVRFGTEQGSVTLGGRRVVVCRPRVRSADGQTEKPLLTYALATSRDLLDQHALQQMLLGMSSRNYARGLEPLGPTAELAFGHSRAAISRRFIDLTKYALDEMLMQNLAHLKPVALMIDGVGFGDVLCLVALVIDTEGRKHPVGILEGCTENDRAVMDLLTNLKDRGLDCSHGLLVVIDGAKALASGVRKVFGKKALIQRCIEHKIRNVKDYLPKEMHHLVSLQMRQAYRRLDAAAAERELKRLAQRFQDAGYSQAASSLREGLYETLTINRLGVAEVLRRTLRSTNAIESMFEIVRAHHRNVKRWRNKNQMAMRWAAAGIREAEKKFRRVEGYKHLPALARALHYHTEVAERAKAA